MIADREILRGLSFAAEPGQTGRLSSGPTGAGKRPCRAFSTALRYWQVAPCGLNGRDIRDITQGACAPPPSVCACRTRCFVQRINDWLQTLPMRARNAFAFRIEQAAARCAQIHDFIASLRSLMTRMVGDVVEALRRGRAARSDCADPALKNPAILIL